MPTPSIALIDRDQLPRVEVTRILSCLHREHSQTRGGTAVTLAEDDVRNVLYYPYLHPMLPLKLGVAGLGSCA